MAFHDVLFPADISYGATGGPRFSTVINTVGSGREERIIRWDQPLMSWDVGHEITDETKLEALLAFFRAREGGTIRLYDAGGNLLTRSTDGLTGVVSGGPATSWAGKFHVPVRFEDDELKISIRGVRRGNWPNVGLVELRE